MQTLLQKLFERECRNYEFYLQKYKRIERQYDVYQERIDEIDRENESSEIITEIGRLLNSEAFTNGKEKIKLPENFSEFEKVFLEYKPKDTVGEKEYLSRNMQDLSDVLLMIKSRIKSSKELLFGYINMAHDKGLKFSFTKNDKVAVEMFVLYYSDKFKFDSHRNLIKVEGCKLDETFMNFYMAETEGEQVEAYKWFEETAKKYKVF